MPESNSIAHERRVDPYAVEMFKSMGYNTKLSNNMVKIYKEAKSKKDKLTPGRLTNEGFAFVAILADMADGKLSVVAPAEDPGFDVDEDGNVIEPNPDEDETTPAKKKKG